MAQKNSVLRVRRQDQYIKVVYSVHNTGSFAIEGTVNGAPFPVTFAQDGGLLDDPRKLGVDPAFDELFRGISRDLTANKRGSNPGGCTLMSRNYCGALWDVIEGAQRVHGWLSLAMPIYAEKHASLLFSPVKLYRMYPRYPTHILPWQVRDRRARLHPSNS